MAETRSSQLVGAVYARAAGWPAREQKHRRRGTWWRTDSDGGGN